MLRIFVTVSHSRIFRDDDDYRRQSARFCSLYFSVLSQKLKLISPVSSLLPLKCDDMWGVCVPMAPHSKSARITFSFLFFVCKRATDQLILPRPLQYLAFSVLQEVTSWCHFFVLGRIVIFLSTRYLRCYIEKKCYVKLHLDLGEQCLMDQLLFSTHNLLSLFCRPTNPIPHSCVTWKSRVYWWRELWRRSRGTCRCFILQDGSSRNYVQQQPLNLSFLYLSRVQLIKPRMWFYPIHISGIWKS
jgi:hypothetical protein